MALSAFMPEVEITRTATSTPPEAMVGTSIIKEAISLDTPKTETVDVAHVHIGESHISTKSGRKELTLDGKSELLITAFDERHFIVFYADKTLFAMITRVPRSITDKVNPSRAIAIFNYKGYLIKPRNWTKEKEKSTKGKDYSLAECKGATWIGFPTGVSVVVISINDIMELNRNPRKPVSETVRLVKRAAYKFDEPLFYTDQYAAAVEFAEKTFKGKSTERTAFLSKIPKYNSDWERLQRTDFYYDARNDRDSGLFLLDAWAVERPAPQKRPCPETYLSIEPPPFQSTPALPPPPHPCQPPLDLAAVERKFFLHPTLTAPATFTSEDEAKRFLQNLNDNAKRSKR